MTGTTKNESMTPSTLLKPFASRASILLVLLLSLTACGGTSNMGQTSQMSFASVGTSGGVDPERRAYAVALAKELNVPKVLIPARPGITNALGCVVADLRHDFVRTLNRPLDGVEMGEVHGVLAAQEAEGRRLIGLERIALAKLKRALLSR